MPPNPYRSPEERRSRSGPIAAMVLFAVLVLYPLSMGPALYLYHKEHISEETYLTAYAPMCWGIDHAPGAVQWKVDSYLRFWGRLARGED